MTKDDNTAYSSVDATIDDIIKVEATSAPLLAASFLLDQYCHQVNDAFMLCKSQHDNPLQCRDLAQAVLQCSRDTLKVHIQKSSCVQLYNNFWRCLDYNNQDFIYCREEERQFSRCIEQQGGKNGIINGRRLWRGQGPEDGWKEPSEARPEDGSWAFCHHVWWYKNQPPAP